MAQAEETRCLSKEQIKTTMDNYVKVNKLKNVKIIDQGKPVFSRENEAKYNMPHITMFADNYTVYSTVATDPRTNKWETGETSAAFSINERRYSFSLGS